MLLKALISFKSDAYPGFAGDSIIAVSRLRIINIVMIGCCHRNHLSPGLVLIQHILLLTITTVFI